MLDEESPVTAVSCSAYVLTRTAGGRIPSTLRPERKTRDSRVSHFLRTGSLEAFEYGVALMHSFWYEEAERHFKSLENDDPGCAMAHWGEAMSLLRQLVSRPEEPDLQRGWGTHPAPKRC